MIIWDYLPVIFILSSKINNKLFQRINGPCFQKFQVNLIKKLLIFK